MSTSDPTALSADTLGALRNLARKRDGQSVGWIDISGARELTVLGYAVRNQSGWQITASGTDALAAIAALTAGPASPSSVIQFHPR
jgi:hypothetical protein